jgi:hypothetical protein
MTNPILSFRNCIEGTVGQFLCNPSPFVLRIKNNPTNKSRRQNMVLFKVRASGEYGYHYPVKGQGFVLQRRIRAGEANNGPQHGR